MLISFKHERTKIEESKEMKKTKKKWIWWLLLILFAAGFIIAIVTIGIERYQQEKGKDNYQKLQEEVANTKEVEKKTGNKIQEEAVPEDILKKLGIEIPEKNIDFAALKEENEDIYAWIYIPGTKVDYPVLQHPTDDSYYLEHNLDGSKGYPGCIYTEAVNSKDFTDPNTVLYGHNMKDGSMFATLHDYEDRQVFEENPYIFIYTSEKTFVYQIFAAYKYNAIHLIYNFDLNNPEIFQNYLEQIFEIRDMDANIRQDVSVNADNHIITLSTCISGEKNKRFLVQGVLLNDEE